MRKEELENEKKEEREKERKEAQRNPYLAEQMRVAAESSTAQNKDILGKLSKEVKLLMRLDHPNIIKLHQVIETDAEMYIIMEYASGGELIDYIAAKGHLSEREGRKLFRQLISAIDHCHMAGVVHRDLKLENLLLSSDKNLRLSDFGLGRTIRTTDQYLNTFCGTPLYAGPELVSGIKYIGPAADIW
jgi:5'-AMP-activated protein kinase catalytic alpha subunit